MFANNPFIIIDINNASHVDLLVLIITSDIVFFQTPNPDFVGVIKKLIHACKKKEPN